MNIIGVNGFKRSGKGETSKAIAELLPNVHQLGFADKLKILAARSLGYADISDAEKIALMDNAKEKWVLQIRRAGNNHRVKNVTVREFLQNLGNDARVVFGEDFWIDQVLPTMKEVRNVGQIRFGSNVQDYYDAHSKYLLDQRYPGVETLVFTDLRYPNEAARIRALGGRVIEVVRPGVVSDGHASEQRLPVELIDAQLQNGGSLDDLRWATDALLELILPDVIR